MGSGLVFPFEATPKLGYPQNKRSPVHLYDTFARTKSQWMWVALFLTAVWVGSLDFHFLGIQVGFSTNLPPQKKKAKKVNSFLQGGVSGNHGIAPFSPGSHRRCCGTRWCPEPESTEPPRAGRGGWGDWLSSCGHGSLKTVVGSYFGWDW